MTKRAGVRESGGNVFADLGLRDSDQLLAKADLSLEITQVIEERCLTQVEAAEILGVDQPKVSALVRGRLDGFSMERLYRFLNSLGRDIEIIVTPTPKSGKKPSLRVTRRRRASSVPKAPGLSIHADGP